MDAKIKIVADSSCDMDFIEGVAFESAPLKIITNNCEYVDDKNQVYFLNRRQTLDNGTLIIETYVTNERNERVNLNEWDHINGVIYRFNDAKHIGVGRFKSPASSRGLSTVDVVPLKFGWEDIHRSSKSCKG